MLSFGTRLAVQFWPNRAPGVRAIATSVVDCRMARPMVR